VYNYLNATYNAKPERFSKKNRAHVRRHQQAHKTQDNQPLRSQFHLGLGPRQSEQRASEQYCQMSDTRAHTLDASNRNTNYWLGSINALKFSWAQTWLFSPANISVTAQTDAGALISSSTQQNQAYYMCYIAQ
jgi:hypothetical protein